MSDQTLRIITLYGDIKTNDDKWGLWYNDAKNIVKLLGYEPNYFSIDSTTFKSGKVMSLKRSEKKLLKSIDAGDEIRWITIYSLPIDYRVASFDYDVLLIRGTEHVSLLANVSDFKNTNEEMLLDSLKQHIAFKYGEIYDMDRDECPLIYASKANPPSSFKTLKVIKNIQ